MGMLPALGVHALPPGHLPSAGIPGGLSLAASSLFLALLICLASALPSMPPSTDKSPAHFWLLGEGTRLGQAGGSPASLQSWRQGQCRGGHEAEGDLRTTVAWPGQCWCQPPPRVGSGCPLSVLTSFRWLWVQVGPETCEQSCVSCALILTWGHTPTLAVGHSVPEHR